MFFPRSEKARKQKNARKTNTTPKKIRSSIGLPLKPNAAAQPRGKARRLQLLVRRQIDYEQEWHSEPTSGVEDRRYRLTYEGISSGFRAGAQELFLRTPRRIRSRNRPTGGSENSFPPHDQSRPALSET